MSSRVLVDRTEVEAEMNRHRAEYDRLRDFLRELDRFGRSESAPKGKPGPKPNPNRANPIADRLRDFVLRQDQHFDHRALKAAAGKDPRKDQLRAAIKLIVREGVLEVVRQANGRDAGDYRRSDSVNGKTAEGHLEPSAAFT